MPPEQQQQNNTSLILGLVGLVIIVALVMWGLKSSREVSVTNPGGAPQQAREWPSKEVEREFITENTRTYKVAAEYPITGRPDITDKLRGFVEERIDSFKGDIAEFPEESAVASIDIGYEEIQSDIADNYLFHVYTYTGGAHGIELATTFSFDREGNMIALSDLFTNQSRGLQAVSEYVKKELMKHEFADTVWISDGAAPIPDNFDTFIVGEDEVTFIFDPYQVAAYAAGSQRVTVPVAVFRTYANTELFGR